MTIYCVRALRLGAFAIMLLLYAPSLSTAEPESDSESTPRTLLAKLEKDLGEVGVGEPLAVDFDFTNTFGTEIKIERVNRSCRCLSVTIPEKTVAPNDSAKFTIKIDPEPAPGVVGQSVSLQATKGGENIEILLNVSYSVRLPVQWDRRAMVDFGRIKNGESTEVKMIPFVVNPREPSPPISFTALVSGGAFEAQFKQNPEKGWDLYVRAGEGKYVGSLAGQLTVSLGKKDGTQFKYAPQIMLLAYREGAFKASPKSIFLGKVAPGESVEKKISISGSAGQDPSQADFQFTCVDPGAKIEAGAGGASIMLRVSPSRDSKEKPIRSCIEIVSPHVPNEVLRVPFMYIVEKDEPHE